MPTEYARPENFGHPIRNPLIRKHFVYRCFASDGELIYVGCTQDVKARLAAHANEARWWDLADGRITLAGPYNYETARRIEYDAIESERPRANLTSERRMLRRIRDRMTTAYLRVHYPDLPSDINAFMDAHNEAWAAVDAVLPNLDGQPLTDLSLPTARRIEVEFIRALRGAA